MRFRHLIAAAIANGKKRGKKDDDYPVDDDTVAKSKCVSCNVCFVLLFASATKAEVTFIICGWCKKSLCFDDFRDYHLCPDYVI